MTPTLWLLARGTGPGVPLVASIRAALRDIDPYVPLLGVSLLEQRVATLLMPKRMGSALLTALAGLTALLVAIGIVGTVSYAAARRRRETGIRLALGAHRLRVTRDMTRGTAAPVCVGLVVGLGAALSLGRLAAAFLYGVTPTDGVTLVSAVLLLGGIATLAAYLPARRATGLNPMEALRTE